MVFPKKNNFRMSEQSASEKRRRTKSTLTKKKKKNSRNEYKINFISNYIFTSSIIMFILFETKRSKEKVITRV